MTEPDATSGTPPVATVPPGNPTTAAPPADAAAHPCPLPGIFARRAMSWSGRIDGWRYWTNAHVIVFASEMDAPGDTPYFVGSSATLRWVIAGRDGPGDQHPDIPRDGAIWMNEPTPCRSAGCVVGAIQPGPCATCAGTGKIGCDQCDGTGECNACSCEKVHDCGCCDGNGDFGCDGCDGTGKIAVPLRCGSCGGAGIDRAARATCDGVLVDAAYAIPLRAAGAKVVADVIPLDVTRMSRVEGVRFSVPGLFGFLCACLS